MPEPTAVEHHRDVPYAETDFSVQAAFTVAPAADGTGVTVTGLCPACSGRTTTDFERGSPQGFKGLPFNGRGRDRGRRSAPREPGAVRKVTVYCECGHVHENRPEDAIDNGCGAYWLVELTAGTP